MELSKELGALQQQVDEWFERLEAATLEDEAIVEMYEEKLQEIDL
jgi:uncharacterized protein